MVTRVSRGTVLGAFFSFRWMITPWLVRIVFVLGLAGCVWQAYEAGAQYLEHDREGTAPAFLMDRSAHKSWLALQLLRWLVAAPLLLRLACESIIILFRVHETILLFRGDANAHVRELTNAIKST